MTRAHLIERIDRMSDDELERVGPYLEADLEVLEDLDELDGLHREIALGRKSAREEPLVEHGDVMAAALARLSRRS